MSTAPVVDVAKTADEEVKPAPTPEQLAQTKRRNYFAAAIALGLLSLAPIPFGDFGFFIAAAALIYAILGLSVVVVTGYTGLISLMPYSFAGIGATVAALAMASWGWPFWLALPLAAMATVPISVLVGVASVRLKSLYLAIATLTFSNALGETFFSWEAVTGGRSGWVVSKPTLGPLSFTGDFAFYVLCLVTVLFMVWMVEGLRTSRLGRAMQALKDNELEAQALGINVYRTKLASFVLGGMIAGVGGAFLAIHLSSVSPAAFESPFAEVTSILLVTLVVIGGIDRAWGAFFGALSYVVQQEVFRGAEFFFAFFGVYAAFFLILFLLFRPGGLIQVGKIQLELIKERPVFGISVAAGIVFLNLSIAYLFLRSG